MTNEIAIHWFRQDLRLADNPALYEANKDKNILPIYILDDINSKKHQMGAASRWWLHYSLNSLDNSLDNNLNIYNGDPLEIIPNLIKKYNITKIYWNRCYEPWCIKRDTKLKKALENLNIEVNSYNGSLLWEPWTVLKQDGTPYKVFTPFYRKGCLSQLEPRLPLAKPKNLNSKLILDKTNKLNIEKLNLLPNINWDKQLEPHWNIGEPGAKNKLNKFLNAEEDNGINNYKEGRNFPAKPNTSKLSPHIHFGEISPNQIWHAARNTEINSNIDVFCSELGWREFSYYLLYHFPDLPEKNWNTKFDNYPWQNNKKLFNAWTKGQTGIPIVDAGMRELWQTGYIHNRVRMIVGSFLVKNLLTHWKKGEEWFYDCLVDADLASNSASWQWVAGSGADAAPYFRIFNPVLQGQKFDPEGEYTKKFVPELSKLPNKYLFNPWEAPDNILEQAGIELGKTYPNPIVDLKTSRDKALEGYSKIK
jgi:deoxyribodipyrimidine photo-lyase